MYLKCSTRRRLHLIPQNPENLIGTWKGISPKISLTVEVTFTGEGEFRMMGRPDEGRDWVIEGPYTVDNSSWPMKITVVDGDQKHYFAVPFATRTRWIWRRSNPPTTR